MDMTPRVGGDTAEDRIWLVTDAAVGTGSTINLDTQAANPAISMAIEGRVLDGTASRERFDFMMDIHTQAPALVGMLFEQLPPESQQYVIDVWRRHGVAGL